MTYVLTALFAFVLGGIFLFALINAMGRYLPKLRDCDKINWFHFAKQVYKQDQGEVRISPPQMNDAIKATLSELDKCADEQIIEFVRRGGGEK